VTLDRVHIFMMNFTHDELYKKFLRQTFGPNVFPFIKIIVSITVYFLIIILVMNNMYIVMNEQSKTKTTDEQTVPLEPLPRPIIYTSEIN